MSAHAKPAPVDTPFWTPGVILLAALMVTGFLFIIGRFTGGLGAVSHLSQTSPWGIWIGVDVATGVALAAGGFTTAALAHIFGRHRYEAVTRPALLTAMLGYTFVSLGLFIDIGRSWAIWKPIFYWQTNSVLFEVAMCVVIYLHVLYIEFIPVLAERFRMGVEFPGRRLWVLEDLIGGVLNFLDRIIDKIMWVFIILGVVLSCMHQSGLGSLLLIAPTKMHPLWYTPLLPLLFLLSAIAVGFPMVVFETTLATGAMKLEDEMDALSPLTRFTIILLGIYLAIKLGDMAYRGTHVYIFDGSAQGKAFLVEILFGVIIPWCMLLLPGVRSSRGWLFVASTLVVCGVALNRVNVFLVGFKAPYAQQSYFPSVGELAITIGLISSLIFVYRICVKYLPVLSARRLEVSS
ncbi:MAG: Ni/Fe-hydrogenase cytochrome b subunit [Deltaproteobacteria bacterium]|nr:Ni/Fe-hydrogenase cytochrome b subunit [Deltaproteobacteria bacterium]